METWSYKDLDENDRERSHKEKIDREQNNDITSLLVSAGAVSLIIKFVIVTINAPATGGLSYEILLAQ